MKKDVTYHTDMNNWSGLNAHLDRKNYFINGPEGGPFTIFNGKECGIVTFAGHRDDPLKIKINSFELAESIDSFPVFTPEKRVVGYSADMAELQRLYKCLKGRSYVVDDFEEGRIRIFGYTGESGVVTFPKGESHPVHIKVGALSLENTIDFVFDLKAKTL